jgi:hypothetical protein
MVEAAKTTATTGEIWVIVIVAVVALAFWLTAIALADRSQVRASGPRVPVEPGRFGGWIGGSFPGAQDPQIPGEAEHEPIETPDWHERHEVPRQRTGEADRPVEQEHEA